ncbi:sugar transferase [Thalassobium sp. R2A62]|jgi:lipopolysaccharide/colanic/teichoic acid biosynthesis glycosyltransferase|uniref:sugar transferase n=1 Tax=Thalassobium sp. R2A62 TaxID=633131 RepID=UPI0001B1D672|nr:sugar transferase [Thalassobium sp. R2A62]EET48662.1 rb144 [Thalassobium sp. R2A62]
MPVRKRLYDIFMAVVFAVLIAPVFIVIAALILALDGRPVFYVSERMRSMSEAFGLVKFRTMRTVKKDSGVSGGDKAARITRTGRILRRTRLDETPQLWNVLLGHISFVGPRPPLRQYVEKFPEIYQEVLKSRPGVTGLASIRFHAHEEMLLSRSESIDETDEIYSRICVPRKAQFDLIYQKNRNMCYDIRIMLGSVFKKLR